MIHEAVVSRSLPERESKDLIHKRTTNHHNQTKSQVARRVFHGVSGGPMAPMILVKYVKAPPKSLKIHPIDDQPQDGWQAGWGVDHLQGGQPPSHLQALPILPHFRVRCVESNNDLRVHVPHPHAHHVLLSARCGRDADLT
jgi:hypothetical protein